jgi:hypothetical protein
MLLILGLTFTLHNSLIIVNNYLLPSTMLLIFTSFINLCLKLNLSSFISLLIDQTKKYKLGYPERCHNHCFNFNCLRLHFLFEVFFHLNEIEVVSIQKNIKVVFHLKRFRSSSIYQKKVRSSSIFYMVWLRYGCIPKISFLGCLELF